MEPLKLDKPMIENNRPTNPRKNDNLARTGQAFLSDCKTV
jgi:hypothetical protein